MSHISHSKTCNKCSALFFDIEEFKAHTIQHKNSNNEICNICFKVFHHRNLGAHIENVHQVFERDFPCSKCDQQFWTQGQLAHHEDKVHPDQARCNYCDKVFKSHSGLLAHTRRYHTNHYFHCPKCHIISKDQTKLEKHVRLNHQIIFVCSVCEEMCTSRKGLVQHILEKHGLECTEDDYYICPWCREKHPSCDKLNEHFHQEHKAPLEHECKKCDRKFSTKLFLTMHAMELHEFDVDSNSMTNNISIAAALNIKDVKVVEEKIIERNFECQECEFE